MTISRTVACLGEPKEPADPPSGRPAAVLDDAKYTRVWGLIPAQIAAGVTLPVLDARGKPKHDDNGNLLVKAKYTGLHALRHFYASWLINRPEDGGLGLPPKIVQERLGHSSITKTYDRYGHLFPRGDDAKEIDAAERALLPDKRTESEDLG